MLVIAMRKELITSKKLHTDDTVVPVLEKDRKTTKQGRLWVYGNETHIVYDYTPNRSREGPKAFLKGYRGYLQADAYAGYNELVGKGKATLVGCWAHGRRKFVEAKDNNSPSVTVWGTGKATREFCYVEDAAEGIVLATEKYDEPEAVNIGAGFEISIKDLVEKIRSHVGYSGEIIWDMTKPDGQPRRMLDTSRAKNKFGYVSTTDFDAGLMETIAWYKQSH